MATKKFSMLNMTFTKHTLRVFGEQGKRWIADLPNIIAKLADDWQLSGIVPVDNMTFNYVAKATTNTNQAVILKISCDAKAIADEIQALKYFSGNGSIQLIAENNTYHAILLQQAVPGITLTSIYPQQLEYVMDCYIETMKKLHSHKLPSKNNYCHISDWLIAIDHMHHSDFPSDLIVKAITLKNELLSSMTNEIFLHGDLHHDNILKQGDQWLAIDPKGVVGEAEFEIAAFDFMCVNELANKSDVKNILEKRIDLLAQKAKLDPQRMKDWVFVRLMLMAAWQKEDNMDAHWTVKLAEIVAK